MTYDEWEKEQGISGVSPEALYASKAWDFQQARIAELEGALDRLVHIAVGVREFQTDPDSLKDQETDGTLRVERAENEQRLDAELGRARALLAKPDGAV